MKNAAACLLLLVLSGCGTYCPDRVASVSESGPEIEQPKTELSEPELTDPVERPAGDDFNVWRSIGAIIFVIGGLLALNVYLARRRKGGRFPGKRIRLLERTAIDHRRSMLLVEVENRRVLVGVSPDRVEPILTLGSANDPAREKKEESR